MQFNFKRRLAAPLIRKRKIEVEKDEEEGKKKTNRKKF
jgi:hypothetical protein